MNLNSTFTKSMNLILIIAKSMNLSLKVLIKHLMNLIFLNQNLYTVKVVIYKLVKKTENQVRTQMIVHNLFVCFYCAFFSFIIFFIINSFLGSIWGDPGGVAQAWHQDSMTGGQK